jgi:hypothetical protein
MPTAPVEKDYDTLTVSCRSYMAKSLRLEEKTKLAYERGVHNVAVDKHEVPCIGCFTMKEILSGSIIILVE